jgi:iron complex outermembrane recepter protein
MPIFAETLRFFRPLFGVALWVFLADFPPTQAANAQTPMNTPGVTCEHQMDVHVVESFDHEPIIGASVKIDGTPVGVTDRQGHLILKGLCRKQLRLDVVHDAYEVATRRITVDGTQSVEIELAYLVEEFVVEEHPAPPVDLHATAEVSGEALARKRGQSISEALSEVPGVTQLRSGSGLAKPIVRGQFGRRLPFIVDGVRHRSQDWGVDHAPEIDPAMADRITVVRGAAGVRYGPDAIGGAVLVDPPALRRVPGTEGEAHLVGASNGYGGFMSGRMQWVPTERPTLTVQLEGSIKRLAAASTPDYALDNTGAAEWMGGVTVGYRTDNARYQLSFRHLKSKLGVCLCFRVDSASDFFSQANLRRPIESELYKADFAIDRPYQDVAHDLAVARGVWLLGAGNLITATYALQYDDREEFDIVRQAVTGPQFSFRLLTQDADVVFEHKPVHLSDHHHLIGTLGVATMFQTHSYEGLQLVPDHQAGSAGVFATERLLADGLELEAGLRYDVLSRTATLNRIDFLRLVRSGQLGMDACGNAASTADRFDCVSMFHTASASLGGLWHVTSNWSTKLDLSMAMRPPNPDEQYLNGTAPTFPVLGMGKPDLGAETNYSVSLTTNYSSEKISAEVSTFANYTDDYIYFAPAIGADGMPIFDVLIRGAFPRFVTRPVDAVFYGADGSISASPYSWLSMSAQASTVRARNVTDDTYLVFVPANNARASVSFKKTTLGFLNNAEANLAGSYTARQTRYDASADLASPPPAYFLASGSLEADVPMSGHSVRFALSGANLFGQRYREYTSLLRYFADQPGRQLWLRMSLKF